MLDDESLWDKRKEERYDVGAALAKSFGLSGAEQKLIFGKKTGPCLVNNVSFNGINCTAYADNYFEYGREIGVHLLFSNPFERIFLRGIIQSVIVKIGASASKTQSPPRFAVVAARFVEPPLAYKQRLGKFIEGKEAL